VTSELNESAVFAHLSRRGWVSLRQFATLIGVSYPTACRMRDRQEVNAVKVGGIYRVYSDEVQRFMSHGNLSGGDGSG